MKHIKKFSQLVTESSDKAAEIQEVVKRLGYGSLKEIQQEKSLLTKLESLMKELAKSSDVSEDEAEEIEARVIAKGSPKSLANKMGKKEQDGEPGGSNEEEVDEDAAEDIEDAKLKLGEPESHGEDEGDVVVTKDQEVEEEPATSPEDEKAGIKIPKSRIMSFEQFVKEQTTTVNKNVSYRNDAEEEDDALPVAEDTAEEIEDEIVALGKPRKHSEAEGEVAVTKDQEITEDTAEEIEAKIVALGKPRKHSEVEGNVAVTKDQEITGVVVEKQSVEGSAAVNMMKIAKPGRKLSIGGRTYVEHSNRKWVGPDGNEVDWTKLASIAAAQGKRQVLFEQKVSNEKEFEEYAISVLKKAHPDDFDQEVADKVVSGLKSKYKSDFGAMVGALQSSMGK